MAEALNLKDENQSGLVRGMVEGSNPSGPATNNVVGGQIAQWAAGGSGGNWASELPFCLVFGFMPVSARN